MSEEPAGAIEPAAPIAAARARRAPGHLLRVLGIAFGLAIIIGNTIGQGILRTPGEIAARLPTPALFLGVWVAGGLYALLGAISLSELGAMIPRSGGQYVFVRRGIGEYAAFVVGWSDWLSTCGSASLVAIVIGQYSAALFPALRGRVTWVAVGVIVVFALLQWRGVRWGDRAQQVTSLLKALALVALVAACVLLAPPRAAAVVPAAPVGLGLFAAIVVSLQAVIFTYDGWDAVIYFSEEVRDPGRDIPRSMFVGVAAVIAIYLSLNLAFLHVLPMGRIAGEPFVAGAAAAALFGPRGDTVIRAMMIVALLSSVNALQLMASRVPLAMSRDRLLPAFVSRVNAGGTPTGALLAGSLVMIAFIVSGTYDQVLALLAFFFVLDYLLSFTTVFRLRRREPDAPRPYRAWGYPYTTAIALAGSLAVLVGAVFGDRANSVRSIVLLAASWPVFALSRRAGAR